MLAQELDNLLLQGRQQRNQDEILQTDVSNSQGAADGEYVKREVAAAQRVQENRAPLEFFIDGARCSINLVGQAELKAAEILLKELSYLIGQACGKAFLDVRPERVGGGTARRLLAQEIEPAGQRFLEHALFRKRRRIRPCQRLAQPAFQQTIGRAHHPERAADDLARAR